jgi:hypothetical protein
MPVAPTPPATPPAQTPVEQTPAATPVPAASAETAGLTQPPDHDAVRDTLRRGTKRRTARSTSTESFRSTRRLVVIRPNSYNGRSRRSLRTKLRFGTRRSTQVDTATVRAEVARRMSPRVGNPVTNVVQTESRLRRQGILAHRDGYSAMSDVTQNSKLKQRLHNGPRTLKRALYGRPDPHLDVARRRQPARQTKSLFEF